MPGFRRPSHIYCIGFYVHGVLQRRNPALQDVSSDPEALIVEVPICIAVCMRLNVFLMPIMYICFNSHLTEPLAIGIFA